MGDGDHSQRLILKRIPGWGLRWQFFFIFFSPLFSSLSFFSQDRAARWWCATAVISLKGKISMRRRVEIGERQRGVVIELCTVVTFELPRLLVGGTRVANLFA